MNFIKYLPLITTTWQGSCCILMYILAVRKNHVYYMFPYISDTVAVSPESNIFSLSSNINAVLMTLCTFIRYKQTNYDIKTKNIALIPIWNKISAALGYVGSLGIGVVGSFPETSLLVVHIIGALMVIGIGILYLITQTWISTYYLRARQRRISILVYYTRVGVICTVPFLFFNIFYFGYLSFQEFRGQSYLFWNENDGGYHYRLISVFSEWITIFLFFIYTATFSSEFRHVELKEVTFKYKQTATKGK